MTNKERYKKAAEIIVPSGSNDFLQNVEGRTMKMRSKKIIKTVAAAFAAVILIAATGTGVYAADIGGIQKSVGIWLHGDVADVTIKEVGDGQFEVTYPDGSVRGCGGMEEDGHGGMRGVSMESMIAQLRTSVECEQDEDGRIWIYIRDHKIDVTDQIDEKGYAQEKVKDGFLADYITVIWREDGSCAISTSHSGFDSPEKLMQNTR
jgi:hypothetical protein